MTGNHQYATTQWVDSKVDRGGHYAITSYS